MQRKLKRVRSLISFFLFDKKRYADSLQLKNGYLRLTNRMERIAVGPNNVGYVCLWPYTSKLNAPELLPELGRRILKETLTDHEFVSNASIEYVSEEIDVTVLIGHRGIERLPHLLATLSSVASQRGVNTECIVIEQDTSSRIRDDLPDWVNYVFLQSEAGKDGYNRSRAFNCGVRQARGKIVLLHDNDMLMPTHYCKEIVRVARNGYNVMNIKRFVHYLDKQDSKVVMEDFSKIGDISPLEIVQNLEAGGSMAITKEAYEMIGGMDERFIGWGGEDNEFWDRCSTLNKWIWGYISLVHLWHPSQPLKISSNNPNISMAKSRSCVSKEKRIAELKLINNFAQSLPSD